MIPKTLHIVWVGPHDPPQHLIDSWSSKHDKNWMFVQWGNNDKDWINKDQMSRMVNKQNPEWNGVADLMRWEILAKYGGFAVDADSECVKALDSGPEDLIDTDKVQLAYESESVRPGLVGCGFIGGPKGHIFFQRCVEECGKIDPYKAAWTTVGPTLATRIAGEMLAEVRILPAKYFNPTHFSGAAAPGAGESGFEPYARQYWGSTKGYGSVRKRVCWCPVCRTNALRNPWSGTGF